MHPILKKIYRAWMNQNACLLIQSAIRIGNRLCTHMEQAKCDRNDGDSRFYHSFPSKKSAHSTLMVKEGYYEHLTAYVGVGFLADYPPGCFLKAGGLLIFTEKE